MQKQGLYYRYKLIMEYINFYKTPARKAFHAITCEGFLLLSRDNLFLTVDFFIQKAFIQKAAALCLHRNLLKAGTGR